MEKVGLVHGTWESKVDQTDALRFNEEENEDIILVPLRVHGRLPAGGKLPLSAGGETQPSEKNTGKVCPTSLKWGECGLVVAWGLSWPGMASLW